MVTLFFRQCLTIRKHKFYRNNVDLNLKKWMDAFCWTFLLHILENGNFLILKLQLTGPRYFKTVIWLSHDKDFSPIFISRNQEPNLRSVQHPWKTMSTNLLKLTWLLANYTLDLVRPAGQVGYKQWLFTYECHNFCLAKSWWTVYRLLVHCRVYCAGHDVVS